MATKLRTIALDEAAVAALGRALEAAGPEVVDRATRTRIEAQLTPEAGVTTLVVDDLAELRMGDRVQWIAGTWCPPALVVLEELAPVERGSEVRGVRVHPERGGAAGIVWMLYPDQLAGRDLLVERGGRVRNFTQRCDECGAPAGRGCAVDCELVDGLI